MMGLLYGQEKQENNSFHSNRKVLGDFLDIATPMYIHKNQVCRKLPLLQAHLIIGRLVLLIDDRHISPCNSLLVDPASTICFFSSTQPYIDVWPFVLVRHKTLNLLTVAKFSDLLLLVTWF